MLAVPLAPILERTSAPPAPLPVPAVFVAGSDGVIRFAHADPNYKERLAPAKVLEAARNAAGGQR